MPKVTLPHPTLIKIYIYHEYFIRGKMSFEKFLLLGERGMYGFR